MANKADEANEVSEVSEGLGGWMGIRGRLEGRRRDWEWFTLSVYPILPNPYPSYSFLSFHSCQNSPISVSFHLESPSRTSLLPYIHRAVACHVSSFLPSMVCILPVNSRYEIHARRMLGGVWLVYRILCWIYMSIIHAWHTLGGIVVYTGLGKYI